MNITPKKLLTHKEIFILSSVYLREGLCDDKWEIINVEIEGNLLTARIKMSSTFVSPTDPNGFHLTTFSTLEFLSQLMLICGHTWAGYTEKTLEGWMVESNIKCKKTVRNPIGIQVEMEVKKIKKRGKNILMITRSRIFDDHGGHYEASLKGFLA